MKICTQVIEKVNDLNPEILDSHPELYFMLKQQHLIELIRQVVNHNRFTGIHLKRCRSSYVVYAYSGAVKSGGEFKLC